LNATHLGADFVRFNRHKWIGAPVGMGFFYLHNCWVEKLRPVETLEILTPDDASMHAGITSFRLKGKGGKDDNNAVVVRLRDEFKVLTVRRAGVAAGQCIRVSPALYTNEAELDRLVAALTSIASS
jgi:isopenicillin-N epimerase